MLMTEIGNLLKHISKFLVFKFIITKLRMNIIVKA